MLTPITEVAKAMISNATTSSGTTTITYDSSGYHVVRATLTK